MNLILPIDRLQEALNKGLYNVLKEASMSSGKIISSGGKVVIQKKDGLKEENLEVFSSMEEFNKWFEKFIGFDKAEIGKDY